MDAGTQSSGFSPVENPVVANILQAWRWWRGELKRCLPKGFLQAQTRSDYAAVITPDGLQKCGPPNVQWPGNSAVNVYVSQDLATYHTICLPNAARRTLRTAVGYEMDRITPFCIDEVYFTCTAAPKDPDTLTVDVHVVPKALIDPALDALRAQGLRLKRVDIAKQSTDGGDGDGSAPDGLGINLLSQGGGGQTTAMSRAMRLCAFLLIFAMAFAGWSVFHRQSVLLDAYEARLEKLRTKLDTQAAPQGQLRNQAARYAADIVPFTLLMDDLTQRLSDDTYIFALRVDGERLTLSGASRQAAELLTALDASPYMAEPAFSSPIVQDPVTGRERFSLSAKIIREPMS